MMVRRNLLRVSFFLVFFYLVTLLFSSGCGINQRAAGTVVAYIPQVRETEGIPILMYHKVNSDRRSGGLGLRVPVEEFEWQMGYLKRAGYTTITLQDLYDYLTTGKKLPPRPVVITFDDGYLDNYENAYPIMKKHGFCATIFVVAERVGGINSWDVQRGYPANRLMTWEQLKELERNGFDIQAHTLTHPHLTRIPLPEAEKEIGGCKRELEKRLGKKVNFFAYPYGEYNRAIKDLVRKEGYLAAVVTRPQGKVKKGDDLYTLVRVRVNGYVDRQTFVNILADPKEGYRIFYEHKKNIKPVPREVPKERVKNL
ncbi:MAG: hypothetical protein PWQ31_1708 [Eubacteriales bacterium]|nr:hypothetical protein [Eubacteriales bacterium]